MHLSHAVILAVGLTLISCGNEGPDDGGTPVSRESSASGPVGTFTMESASCGYDGPTAIPAGSATFDLVSSERQAQFDLYLMDEGSSYDDLVAHIREEMRRLDEGEPMLGHPTFATLVDSSTTTGGLNAVTLDLTDGEYAMACIQIQQGVLAPAGPVFVS